MAKGKKKTALTLLVLFLLADALLIALVLQRYSAQASLPKEAEPVPVLKLIQKESGEPKFLTADHMTFLPIAFSGNEGHVEILNNSRNAEEQLFSRNTSPSGRSPVSSYNLNWLRCCSSMCFLLRVKS